VNVRELYYTPAHGTVRLRAEDTDTTLLVNGRRRAETMPGGMAPVVEPPNSASASCGAK